jgi:hypothetical protein
VKARPSFEKRRKEMERKDHQRDKAERRKARRDAQPDGTEAAAAEPTTLPEPGTHDDTK